MKLIEKFSGVFLIAGLVMFLGATIALGLLPAFMVDRVHPRQGLPTEVPVILKGKYENAEQLASAVLRGKELYIREACWHCHSQFVRPVANENLRYGPVSTPAEYQSVLHLPQMFGTRRVGPDLSREAGIKSNDWHLAHLYEPTSVVPESVMPAYPWYFEKDKDGNVQPKEDAWAIVAYLQILGLGYMDQRANAWEEGDVLYPPKN